MKFDKTKLVFDNDTEHLPVYIKSTNPSKHLMQILSYLVIFETKVDLALHKSLRDLFQCANLIGPLKDEESFQNYSKNYYVYTPKNSQCTFQIQKEL